MLSEVISGEKASGRGDPLVDAHALAAAGGDVNDRVTGLL